MLSSFEKDIVQIIKSALDGTTVQLSEDFDLEKTYKYAQEHQITPILYYGLCGTSGFMDNVFGKKFFKSTMNLSFYCAEQSETIKSVNKAFKENGIEHLLLKGTIIRDLYPCPEMRLMSDADILIKEDAYSKIKPIMQAVGFEEQYESDHELVWKKNDYTIELHKRLVPSYNKDYYEYFGDGWKLATVKKDDSSEFFMTPEDSFIYTFVHFAKHYRDAGIGVKHLTDFYVLTEKGPALDFDYIENELKRLQLLEFWKNIKNTLECWFKSREWDEKTVYITKKIISSATFGTEDNRTQARALKASKETKHFKMKRIMTNIFPTYKGMCQKYNFLKKAPFLLPVMWIVRWIEAIFSPSKIKAQKEKIDMISNESVSKYQGELNYVGLDFNFEEK